MNNTIDQFIKARNEINGIIDNLVKESLNDFDTYEEAIQAINKTKWDMPGLLGKYVVEEAINRIEKLSLKNTTK
ncbi:hypothetical protein [Lactococcus petauri]|uniref:hypothetical protein n=1 Tax=Lactococcus petauri TaxID=1940789 RepID=UPI0018A90F35|nr:hypothetical protein [Lactococcus petauri]MDC0825475.1 hypothetical protein [Lactococcus petauri]